MAEENSATLSIKFYQDVMEEPRQCMSCGAMADNDAYECKTGVSHDYAEDTPEQAALRAYHKHLVDLERRIEVFTHELSRALHLKTHYLVHLPEDTGDDADG